MPTTASRDNRLRSWLYLGLLISNNPARRRAFLAHYGTLEAAVRASRRGWRSAGLLRLEGGKDIFGPVRPGGIPEVEAALDDTGAWADEQISTAGKLGASFLCLDDPGYPEWLRATHDPPALLHVRGDAGLLAKISVAVVGARRATAYGLTVARSLGAGLAREGVSVVSGGARGIDREAHAGALEESGPTVVVTGAGLDRPYPAENKGLFDRVAERGAVISEFPFGAVPQPHHFPIRNRVIAGLSAGVVVVEGAAGSGSLITAACALEAGREVFAVPGLVTSPLSEGPNGLLREGATLVRSAQDILEGLPAWAWEAGLKVPENRRPPTGQDGGVDGAPAGPEEALLSALDGAAGRTADDLAHSLGMAAGDLLGALMELELKGRVRQLPGGIFVRRG